jgi:hypothetical protein
MQSFITVIILNCLGDMVVLGLSTSLDCFANIVELGLATYK